MRATEFAKAIPAFDPTQPKKDPKLDPKRIPMRFTANDHIIPVGDMPGLIAALALKGAAKPRIKAAREAYCGLRPRA